MTKLFLLGLSLLLPSAIRAEETLGLEELLRNVRSENLGLKAEGAAAAAARAAAGGVGLPAPMIGVSRLTDSSGRARGLEVSQTIPFPGKLVFERSARKKEAASAEALRRARETEILADARLRYFQLWQAQERRRLLQEKRDALEEHLRLARAATRSDSFLRIHVLRAEGDIESLANEIAAAEQELRERQIEIAALLGRDPAGFRPRAREFPLSAIPAAPARGSARLEARRAEVEALASRAGAERSAWLPDLNVRYREMSGTPMNPRYSEIMVGASLPFLTFWEPRAAGGKAAAERLRGEYLLGQEKREVEARRGILLARAESLAQRLGRYREKLLPLAEKQMRLVHNVAPRDMETIQNHRETMEAFPDLKLRALDLREQYEETVAELGKLRPGGEDE